MTHTPLSRRAVVASGLIAVTAIAGRQAGALTKPATRRYDLAQRVPADIPGYVGDRGLGAVLPDPAEERAVAHAYEDVLVRTYRNAGGDPLMLVIAHGQPDSGMLAVHRPEICYTAQGFSVVPLPRESVGGQFATVEAARLFASHEDRQEPVLYWATVAGEQSGLGIEQKLRILRASLAGRPADSFLIRMSTIGPNDPQSFSELTRFARAFLQSLSPATRADFGAA